MLDGALIGGALIGGPSKTKSRTNTFVLESKAAPIDHEMGFTHVLATTVETDKQYPHTPLAGMLNYMYGCVVWRSDCVCVRDSRRN
jgi:hypothetical protein